MVLPFGETDKNQYDGQGRSQPFLACKPVPYLPSVVHEVREGEGGSQVCL